MMPLLAFAAVMAVQSQTAGAPRDAHEGERGTCAIAGRITDASELELILSTRPGDCLGAHGRRSRQAGDTR
jgi:hypothetical protein